MKPLVRRLDKPAWRQVLGTTMLPDIALVPGTYDAHVPEPVRGPPQLRQ